MSIARARTARLRAPLALLATPLLASPWRALAAGDAAPPGRGPHVEPQRLPAPGSYVLPRIQRCPEGDVLDSTGTRRSLHAALGGRISLLSFMYTYCRDAYGCPLAFKAMHDARDALLRDTALAARCQLVSLSFDPTHDTPEQMALHGRGLADDARVRWQFLTTASVRKLLPLLEGLGQDVSVEFDAAGRATRTLNHLLKLFLVDERRVVREIYGVATTDAAVLLNDFRTLALEPSTVDRAVRTRG